VRVRDAADPKSQVHTRPREKRTRDGALAQGHADSTARHSRSFAHAGTGKPGEISFFPMTTPDYGHRRIRDAAAAYAAVAAELAIDSDTAVDHIRQALNFSV
jgi:hypothetical protein